MVQVGDEGYCLRRDREMNWPVEPQGWPGTCALVRKVVKVWPWLSLLRPQVVSYLAGCGLQSCPMLLAKGYPDIGWNPCGGERYLDFLRFAVFVNGEAGREAGPRWKLPRGVVHILSPRPGLRRDPSRWARARV